MKNRSSWNDLAQSWGSATTTVSGGLLRQISAPHQPQLTNAAHSFETFKKQAIERQKINALLHHQETKIEDKR